MTNREMIAEMKVVDFFAKYVYYKGSQKFDVFFINNLNCNNCTNPCGYEGSCDDRIIKWLDEEVQNNG